MVRCRLPKRQLVWRVRMALARGNIGLSHVRELLKAAAHGDPSAFGGLELWSFSRAQMLESKLGGLPLIVAGKPGHACCGGGGRNSALLLGLRGECPFDGSRFPQLPWGKPPLEEDNIGQIEEYITDRSPHVDFETN